MTDHAQMTELAAHRGNVVRSEVNKDADYDLEQWMQAKLLLQEADSVLDLGCGNGKQCRAFSTFVGPKGHVTGVDIFSSVEGLRDAADRYLEGLANVSLLDHDASKPFAMADASFDAITSAYSIYYLSDLEAVLVELKRLLKPSGKLFVVGPAWDNSREFYDLHIRISGQQLSSNFTGHLLRINDEVLPLAFRIFDHVEISPFVNRVFFRGEVGLQRLLDYYRNSMLAAEASQSDEQTSALVARLEQDVKPVFEQDGQYIMFKRALGITCYKK